MIMRFLLPGLMFLSTASLAAQNALTTFEPSKDFFPVLNTGVRQYSYRGSCLGIVESALSYWDAVGSKGGSNLATLGQGVINARGQAAGETFLQHINTLAHNHSYNNLFAQPRAGDRLADLVYADMNRTHKPQVIGLDLPDKSRHAVLAYDAKKDANGIAFRVGDPNDPTDNHRWLVYNKQTNSWTTKGNWKEWAGGQLPKGFNTAIVRWDERQVRSGAIPQQGKFLDLINRAVKPGASANAIATELGLRTPLFRAIPETKVELNHPQGPNIGAYAAEARRVRQFLADVANLPRHLQMNRLLRSSPVDSGFGGVVVGNAPKGPRVRSAKFTKDQDQVGIVVDTENGEARFTDLSPTELWVAYHFLHPNQELRAQGAEKGDFGLVGILKNKLQQDGSWDFSVHPALANTWLGRDAMRLDMILSLRDPRLPAFPRFFTYRWQDERALIAVADGKVMVKPASVPEKSLMRVHLWTKDKEIPFDMGPQVEKLIADFPALQSIDRFARLVAVLNWLDEAGKLPALPPGITPEKFQVPNQCFVTDLAFPGMQTFYNWLTAADPFDRWRKESHCKVVPVFLAAGKTYVIDLISPTLDTFLRIEDADQNTLAHDDDSAGNRDSRVIFRPQRDGTYRLIATTFEGGAKGCFTLSVWEGNIGPGQKAFETAGRLTANDPADRVLNTPSQVFEVFLEQGIRYNINLRSKDFDTYLRVEDMNRRQLAADDDSGGDNNSRLAFTSPRTGLYRLIATEYKAGAGAFVLTVERAPASGR